MSERLPAGVRSEGPVAPPRPSPLLVVTNNYPSDRQPDVGTFVEPLMRAWVRRGIAVTVVAPHPWWSPSTGLWWSSPPERGEGAPTVLRPGHLGLSSFRLAPGLSTRRLGLRPFTGAVRRAVRRERARAPGRRPALVYAHFVFPGGWAALRLARELGVPSAVAVGESDFDAYEADLGLPVLRRTLAGFDGVLCVSEANRDACAGRYGVAPERLVVVPNAVDPAVFHPGDRAAARRALGLPAERPLVLFLGRFEERKGPLRLLRALRAVPEAGGLFLGQGEQWPRGEQVVHAGPVAHDQVPRWLAAADLLALPTRAEGSPNAVLEAMACGLPVVAGDVAGVRELLGPDEGVLVPPDDEAALGEALRALLGDAARRARLGERGRARAARSTLEARASRILDWLATLAARGPGAGGAPARRSRDGSAPVS